ncbi:Ppx/GppA family phosphatase [Facklamia sp. DSM 111018]|uniref:Ppx/GppA family phosphatase n=1 Tax=Facklamia lactis TaxID=2749967 RepID=A0ABS0LQX7_9LACT|nr:Ppx/GppA family phosphatase [Facklamia lactis]MBG9980595.1 Ppx/GppA family phosphatase [Facklamia lactis]MBG9986409.1 Ppx/GppA family phosphatase [Facklamia lactis]
MYSNKIGLIDIGSNTIRLVIYGINEFYDINEVTNLKTPARLSRFLVKDNHAKVVMNQEGINLLTETLAGFSHTAKAHQVNDLLIMATAAIRQSANQAQILETVKQETGIDIKILTEEQEASYGQYAIAHTMSLRNIVTIDIGGGSCELTLVEDKQLKEFHSFPFGVVSLKEMFFQDRSHNDPKAIEEARAYIKKQFKSIPWLKKIRYPIVAVGGSARNIAQVHQRLQHYPIAGIHGYRLSEFNLLTTLELFASTSYEEMDNIDGLSSDRTDLIIQANLAFLELIHTVKAPTLYISNQGLREGIIMHYLNDHYNQPIHPDLVKVRSIQKVCRDFKINTKAATIRTNIVLTLYRQLCDLGQMEYSYSQHLELELASYLYHCGQFISQEADSQHTFYLLSNMNLEGFSHKYRVRLALLSSFRNKSLLYQYCDNFVNWFNESELFQLQQLGGLIKFSEALNDSQTAPIHHLEIVAEHNQYRLDIYHHGPIVAEQYRAERHLKHLERALDDHIRLNYIETPLNQ